MAAVTIRNLSEEAHRALKVRAAQHNRSTDAEMRAIVEAAVRPEGRLGTALSEMSRNIGFTNCRCRGARTWPRRAPRRADALRMILLDTNVVSDATKPEPHPSVLDWLDAQATETVLLSSVTVAELLFGIGALPRGRRKDRPAATLDGVLELFSARILPFDTAAAQRYADLAVKARSAGKGFPTRRLHRCNRHRARVRCGIARHECVQGCRSDGNRSLTA